MNIQLRKSNTMSTENKFNNDHTSDPARPALTVVPNPAADESASGWETTPQDIMAELKLAKADLAKTQEDLAAARAGMFPTDSAVKANHLIDAFVKKAKAADAWSEEELVAMALMDLRAKDTARRLYNTENIDADLSLFDGTLSLTEALAARYELPEWRVKGLLRVGHITTVAGPAKSGKTSLLVNRLKALVDGGKLFGEYEVGQQLKGNIGVWNFELTPGQMVDWFRKAGIENTDRIRIVNARGAGLFIQNELVMERAIDWINRNEIEYLEIDPLQAAFLGGISKDEDAADYIACLQKIQKESCVSDIVLTTHMGHAAKNSPDAERSIGSARWEGFPDNQWIYTRKGNDPAKLRIDRGRDVFLDEIGLTMDLDTKILTKVFVPKPIDENWNAMLRMLKDGQPHEKAVVKEANGTAAANKSAIIKHLEWIEAYGLIEEFPMRRVAKEASCTEYAPDGEFGQAKKFVRMTNTGIRLLQEETEQVPLPDRLWFEGHNLLFVPKDKS